MCLIWGLTASKSKAVFEIVDLNRFDNEAVSPQTQYFLLEVRTGLPGNHEDLGVASSLSPITLEDLYDINALDPGQLVICEDKFQVVLFVLQVCFEALLSEVLSDFYVAELQLSQHLFEDECLRFVVFDNEHFVDV